MRILSVVAALALAPLLPAQEVGKLPYKMLDEIFQKTSGLDRSKVAVRVVISSKNSAVKPGDITLTIDSKTAGAAKLALGPDGSIRDFPQNEALRKENPFIVSNQPKGTLNMTADVGLPVPAEKSFPYQRLVDGLTELNAAIKKQAGVLGVFVGAATKVNFQFGDPKATVTVPTKSGPTTLKADAQGNVSVLIDATLAKSDAQVTVSERPKWLGLAK
ncbi:MAG: hypothetical protein JSR82_15255 [Verrucomicrobia bacterium]|nr:hypothetical protein [Verrucomicrobiota bacterium]